MKEMAPDEPIISDTLGWVLYKRGVYQPALALLRDSATRLPDNPEAQYHLGMTYYRLQEREAAKEALARALTLSSQFPGAGEARRTLAELEKAAPRAGAN